MGLAEMESRIPIDQVRRESEASALAPLSMASLAGMRVAEAALEKNLAGLEEEVVEATVGTPILLGRGALAQRTPVVVEEVESVSEAAIPELVAQVVQVSS